MMLGLILGLAIGAGFAALQWLALQKNERAMPAKSWSLLPGSAARVALLLGVLVLAQVFVPQANLWWMTGGVVGAVAVSLLWRVKKLLAARG
jgi:hypothetical protein